MAIQWRDRDIGRLFEGVRDAVVVARLDSGQIVQWNAAASAMFGYGAAEAAELAIDDLFPLPVRVPQTRMIHELSLAPDDRPPGAIELLGQRQDGRQFYLEMTLSPIQDADGQTEHALAIIRDVSERKAAQERLKHVALHDSLTGLPNRLLFTDRLEQAFARSGRGASRVAILLIDIDNFKLINDSLGHDCGDQLLVAVAKRLQNSLRQVDSAARLGGDEFAVLLEGIHTEADAQRVAERILDRLKAPYNLSGYGVSVTVSIGIALSTHGYHRPANLLNNADVAMYAAKGGGKARAAVFDPNMNTQVWEYLELDISLRQALGNGEFRVYYQPIVDLDGGVIEEVEALVRWEHPRRGLLTPGEFMPLAEQSGLILPIGQWVLQEACGQVAAWHREHPDAPKLCASVNLSARQFREPTLVDEVERALAASGLNPRYLTLEITESMVMEHGEGAVPMLQRLKGIGVQLAIDDFGTGYSSLSYLKRFPVDALKIDRSFVERLGDDPDDEVIASAVIGLGRALRLRVVAEGIETPTQLAAIQRLGCHLGQGYIYSRPVTGDALSMLLSQRRGRLAVAGLPSAVEAAISALPAAD